MKNLQSSWKTSILVAALALLASISLAGCITVQYGGGSAESASSTSDQSASADASSSTTSTDSSGGLSADASSSAEPTEKMKDVGSEKVGHVMVPESWEDHTSDVDSKIRDAYGTVYWVDPSSQYTSAAQGGSTGYSRAVQLTVQPTSYTEVADQIEQSYRGNPDMFSNVNREETTVTGAGHKAIVLTASVPADNLQICTYVYDRDDNGKAAVALTMNCGSTDSEMKTMRAHANYWTRV